MHLNVLVCPLVHIPDQTKPARYLPSYSLEILFNIIPNPYPDLTELIAKNIISVQNARLVIANSTTFPKMHMLLETLSISQPVLAVATDHYRFCS
jgi:hypothetical protein